MTLAANTDSDTAVRSNAENATLQSFLNSLSPLKITSIVVISSLIQHRH
jgi:hypothetical protein